MPAISASAPGKVILCGEHAVVYGFPAIAVPVFQVQSKAAVFALPTAKPGEVRLVAPAIDMKTSLSSLDSIHPFRKLIDLVMMELGITYLPACEIRITSTIPVGSGLGSSASVSIAVLRAVSAYLGHPFDDKRINQLAFEIEKIHHGNPSGIDNTVITFQKPVFFQRDKPIQLLSVKTPLHLLIADSGIAASTAEAVDNVRLQWQQDPKKLESIFAAIGDLVVRCKVLLEKGEISGLGDLLNMNHSLLQELQVSNTTLDKLVNAALSNGARGAKLSGGGLGGNIIALVDEKNVEDVRNALIENGAVAVIHTFLPSIGVKG